MNHQLSNNTRSTQSSLVPGKTKPIQKTKPIPKTNTFIRTRSRTKLEFSNQSTSNLPIDQPKINPLTRDHSDIYAIIDSHTTSDAQEQKTSEGKSPKRIRVALMGGKNTDRPTLKHPSLSPTSSRPTSPDSQQPLRRVLSRVLSSSSASSLFGTQAQQHSPVQPRLQPSIESQLPVTAPQHEPINTNHLVSLFTASHPMKKTYGSQRTFKLDDRDILLSSSQGSLKPSEPSSACLHFPSASNDFKTQGSYNELRKKWGVDQDDEPLLNQPELQSTLHQRSSGSSKRFTDELLYLIEGLSHGPNHASDLNLKRTNAIEFIRKFKDESFLDQLRNDGLIEQFYNSFRSAGAGDGDPILDHALLIFISAMCCSGQKFIEPVLRILPKDSNQAFSMQSDCLQVLATLATRPPPIQSCSTTLTTSITKSLKTSSRSKLQQPQLLTSQIQQVVQESVLHKYISGSSSPTLLSLFSLARIAMFFPRPGLLPQRLIVQSGAFVSVINCLKVHSHHLYLSYKNSDPDHLHKKKEPSSTEDELEEVLKHVGYCVDVIEACTVCYEEEALNLVDSFRVPLVSVFSHLIESGHFLASCDHFKFSMQALDISIGCVRTMVNITNFNSVWTGQLSTSSVLEALFGFFKICRSVSEEFNYEEKNEKNSNCGTKLDSNLTRNCHYDQPQKREEEMNHPDIDSNVTLNVNKTSKAVDKKKSKSLIRSSSNLREKPRECPSERPQGIDQIVFDLLCVTLSLMINLLEQSANARKIFPKINLPAHSSVKTKQDNTSASETHEGNNGFQKFHNLSGSVTSGFEELIKLYVRPPCRHLDEKKFIRGSVCVLINFLLLGEHENDNSSDIAEDLMDEKESQTMLEVKIIHGFNTVFSQVGFDGFQDETSGEGGEEVIGEDPGQKREELNKRDEPEEAEWKRNTSSNGLIKSKNLLVIKFIEDLKFYSGLNSINMHNNHGQVGHSMRGSNNSRDLFTAATATNHHRLGLKSLSLKTSLEASLDRLRVGLI